jgi:hypothetical protein
MAQLLEFHELSLPPIGGNMGPINISQNQQRENMYKKNIYYLKDSIRLNPPKWAKVDLYNV